MPAHNSRHRKVCCKTTCRRARSSHLVEHDTESPPTQSCHFSGKACALICAALLLIHATLSYTAARKESPTFDEPLHAASGYLARWMSDYRVDVEDPALFTLLSTLPQSRSDLKLDPTNARLGRMLLSHDRQWPLAIKMMLRTPGADGV